jgi:hypothetical protein
MYYNTKPPTENSGVIWGLAITLALVSVLAVILIFTNSSNRSKMIKPENCPKITGDYGIIPNVDPNNLTIVNQCSENPDGSPGTKPCTFANNKNGVTINNLYDAENICNKYSSDVCEGFYFNSATLSMSFYLTSYPPSSSTSSSANNTFVDVYTKQTKTV